MHWKPINNDMKALNELQNILAKLNEIGNNIRREGAVYAAELRDRREKQLTGDAAIEHYNAWMQAAGMEHLMVK